MGVTTLSGAPYSLCFFNKIFTNPSFHFYNSNSNSNSNSIPLHFNSKPKTLNFSLKIKTTHYYPSFSLRSSSSSSIFDRVELSEDENNKEDGEDEIESKSGGDCRLYVGNLPYAMTSSQLADIFAEAGHVVTVQIVYDKVTDRSRGFGFVTMASIEEAREAISMFDGSQVGGRTVRVNFPEVPKGGEMSIRRRSGNYQVAEGGFVDTPHKLYAGNLSWSLTSKVLREAFEDLPGFLSAKVIYDRDTGTSRGFGFITFSSAEEVESALKSMNGVELEGRPLLLKLASQRAALSRNQQ